MIGRLRGSLVSLSGAGVVVDVGGVGYEVSMTPRAMAGLPPVGSQVLLHTHLHVREEEMSLFGFPNEADRDLFRVLLLASGVGPRLASSILGTLAATEVRRAIAAEDVDALTIVPGIGKRGAQKLVLELRPRMIDQEADVVGADGNQVRYALEGLGYSPPEIREALAGLDREASLEDQIRSALRVLSR